MDKLHHHWFEPPRIKTAVSYILDKCQNVPAGKLDDVQKEREQQKMKMALIAGGGALAFLVLVTLVLSMFAKPVEGKMPDYGRLALICLTVVGGTGAVVFYLCGSNNSKRADRDAAFEKLCQRFPRLRPARHTEIVGDCVGTVPWFMSEEGIHAYGQASGKYQSTEIAVVECTHVVDPILTSTDSKLLQSLSGIVSKKQHRLYQRVMEATVFVEPLEDVSDLVFVPQVDASRAYYKRALSSRDCDLSKVLKPPRRLSRKYWMAAAAPEKCHVVFTTRLIDLLEKRKWCIVQVVGGHCVVMTDQWHGNRPSQAPKTETRIAENLEFAHGVYQELKRNSAAAQQITTGDQAMGVPLQETSVSSTSSAEDTTATSVSIEHGSRRPHSLFAKFLLFGLGVLLFLFGLMVTLGYWMKVNQGHATLSWPQADAVIMNSSIDVNDSGRFVPLVSYEYEVDGQNYTNDRIQHGLPIPTRDKPDAERVLAKYPKGNVVKAYYDASRPHLSVLARGVENESIMLGVMVFMGSLTVVGCLMCVYGAMGKRRRPGL